MTKSSSQASSGQSVESSGQYEEELELEQEPTLGYALIMLAVVAAINAYIWLKENVA
jgi:hypothetical protein